MCCFLPPTPKKNGQYIDPIIPPLEPSIAPIDKKVSLLNF